MPLTPEGWTLLTTWEGCELSAYPDPASGGAPWTIGYGHTGPDVVRGLTISQAQAEACLKQDAVVAAGAVDRLVNGVGLTPRRFTGTLNEAPRPPTEIELRPFLEK
jgi:GH24 family phage-related lysozyme (muramidase)